MNSPNRETPVLAVVVPCYNEEPVIEETARRLLEALAGLRAKSKIADGSFVYFVDDGSGDGTWGRVAALHARHPEIRGLKLAGNVGHQNALLSGILEVKDRADCAVSIDADLQDDVEAIERMVDGFAEGNDVVYGVRRQRATDTVWKRQSAQFFYRFIRLMGVDVVYNHSDFRLLSRRVMDSLAGFREVNLFLRGIVPSIGFQSTIVHYDRGRRFAGESKYPLRKMLSFAFDGITSFSVVPLRFVTAFGMALFVLSILLSGWVVTSVIRGNVVPGWASTVLPVYILGGLQLVGIGLVGEYIGKIYKEVKARPRFIKEEELF